MHQTDAPASNVSSSGIGRADISRRALLRGAAAGSLAGLSGILPLAPPAAARQGQATPAASAAPTHRLSLGQIEVVALNDGMFEAPIAFFAINAPEAALAEHLASAGAAPDGMVTISIQPLLVETDGQRVLLDTGIGPGMQGQLMASLEAAGVAPGDIETVFISHLHADHIGGLLDASGAPAFPNARVLINTAEQEFWASEPSLDELISPPEMKAQSVQAAVTVLDALQDAIELIAPGDEIAPGLTAVDARGHTPGHLALEIVSDEGTLLYIADAAHVPVIQLQRPGWFMVADNWPAWAVTTRQALFDRAASENLLVAASHFPFPGIGRVTDAEVGWNWTVEG